MRKQYYFRPSSHGVVAWDVDRLVTLSRDLPHRRIPLSTIQELNAVMDGMHRVAKAILQGRADIEAVQFAEDPEPDHVGLGPKQLP